MAEKKHINEENKEEQNKPKIKDIDYKTRWRNFLKTIKIEAPSSDNEKILIDDKYRKEYKKLQSDMIGSYPMLHGSILTLMQDFISIKAKSGTDIEKSFYSKKCTSVVDLADRIATKRAVKFYAQCDDYLLRNGDEGSDEWHLVGTNKEGTNSYGHKTLILDNYMSYDEISLSSMCGISSPTTFINNGDRYNKGNETKDKDLITPNGIYMGLIGSRFERDNVMEKNYMVISSNQNLKQMGFGKEGQIKNKPILSAFAKYYGLQYFPEYNEFTKKYNQLKKKNKKNNNNNDKDKDNDDDNDTKKDDNSNNNSNNLALDRYYERYGEFLDKWIYKIRMRVSIELYLFDCDRRGGEYKKTKKGNYRFNGSFCHFIGLGTGVWAMNSQLQDQLLIEIVSDVVKETSLPNIDHIEFSYMNSKILDDGNFYQQNDEDGGLSKVPTHIIKDYDKHKITVNASKRNPSDSIKTKQNILDDYDTNYAFDGRYWHCLLCAMYAWDGNSFPGNEYWENSLSASGDPAAAACSTIPFTQNSEINKEYINGKNTCVYFRGDKGKYEYQTLSQVIKTKDWDKKAKKSIPYPKYRNN